MPLKILVKYLFDKRIKKLPKIVLINKVNWNKLDLVFLSLLIVAQKTLKKYQINKK